MHRRLRGGRGATSSARSCWSLCSRSRRFSPGAGPARPGVPPRHRPQMLADRAWPGWTLPTRSPAGRTSTCMASSSSGCPRREGVGVRRISPTAGARARGDRAPGLPARRRGVDSPILSPPDSRSGSRLGLGSSPARAHDHHWPRPLLYCLRRYAENGDWRWLAKPSRSSSPGSIRTRSRSSGSRCSGSCGRVAPPPAAAGLGAVGAGAAMLMMLAIPVAHPAWFLWHLRTRLSDRIRSRRRSAGLVALAGGGPGLLADSRLHVAARRRRVGAAGRAEAVLFDLLVFALFAGLALSAVRNIGLRGGRAAGGACGHGGRCRPAARGAARSGLRAGPPPAPPDRD